MSKSVNSNQRKHSILFFLALFLCATLTYYFWQTWHTNVQSQALEDIERSEDIEILLSSASYLENHTKKTQETLQNLTQSPLLKQVREIENEVTQLFSNEKQELLRKQISQEVFEEDIESGLDDVHEEKMVNLAFKNIFLQQGENGVQKWRLMAEWATFRQGSSLLSVHKPTLIYRTSTNPIEDIPQESDADLVQNTSSLVDLSDLIQNTSSLNDKKSARLDFYNNMENALFITSDTGIIRDNSKIYLRDNVLAKQNENSVKGDLLFYDDKTSLVIFPESGYFSGENIHGSAQELRWDLDKSTISGTGRVEIIWTPQKES